MKLENLSLDGKITLSEMLSGMNLKERRTYSRPTSTVVSFTFRGEDPISVSVRQTVTETVTLVPAWMFEHDRSERE